MHTHVNTRFLIAVHVLVHAVQRAIFVINIVEMSQEYTGKEAVEKLIKALDHPTNKDLHEAFVYASEYSPDKNANIDSPEFPFYSAIIYALVKLAKDILNKDNLTKKYIKKRDHEFIYDINQCHTEYNTTIRSSEVNSKKQDDLQEMLEDVEDIYHKYSTFYLIVKDPKRLRSKTWKHRYGLKFNKLNIPPTIEEDSNSNNNNNRGNHKGGRRTMRAKRRRQI
jgi:hypothetical protein